MVGSASASASLKIPGASESFYIETVEGCFFAVKGLEHPPDRLVAVLRYAPDPEEGERIRDGRRYRRLYRFAEQETWIRKRWPHYLAYDPVFQTTLQSVPVEMVCRLYDPCRRSRELISLSGRSPLEVDAAAFLQILRKRAYAPLSALGISGSLLIGLHHDHSDIDISVFGESDCIKVHRALKILLDEKTEENLGRLNEKGMKELYAQRVVDTPMDYCDFLDQESRKVNQGFFGDRTWFIRFVKKPGETADSYGDRIFCRLGRLEIQATVADDSDAIFTPCRYGLSEVRKIVPGALPEPDEIVSFRGRFCEQARDGDRIAASGIMERVECGNGRRYHRLLLGNSPQDTLTVIR
ncbi:MAG: hypothetical protein P8Z37_13210 [Acidobacteriota bacterium]